MHDVFYLLFVGVVPSGRGKARFDSEIGYRRSLCVEHYTELAWISGTNTLNCSIHIAKGKYFTDGFIRVLDLSVAD